MKTIFTQLLDKLPNNSTRFLVAMAIVLATVVIGIGIPLSNNFTTIYIKQQEVALELEKLKLDDLVDQVDVLEQTLSYAYLEITDLKYTVGEQNKQIVELVTSMQTLKANCDELRLKCEE